MAEWTRLCSAAEAPVPGQVAEAEVNGQQVCLARTASGQLAALDNLCPHREGPLGQGWLEGDTVVCPWHSWAFRLDTGAAEFPEGERVRVFPVREEAGEVLIQLTPAP